MSTKKWKNKELSENLSERFGIKMNLSALNESYDLKGESKEEDQRTLYQQGFDDAIAGLEPADDAPREPLEGGYQDGYNAGEEKRVSQDAEVGRRLQSRRKVKEELKDPKKADLNKDGKISGYEKRRGKAIEDSIKDQD